MTHSSLPYSAIVASLASPTGNSSYRSIAFGRSFTAAVPFRSKDVLFCKIARSLSEANFSSIPSRSQADVESVLGASLSHLASSFPCLAFFLAALLRSKIGSTLSLLSSLARVGALESSLRGRSLP
jgi:hypothetical protein